jgi:hypothetical protein
MLECEELFALSLAFACIYDESRKAECDLNAKGANEITLT